MGVSSSATASSLPFVDDRGDAEGREQTGPAGREAGHKVDFDPTT